MRFLIQTLLFALSLALAGAGAFAQSFSFDDLEKLEAAEQQELLELSRQAAKNRNFTQAKAYLEQARHKGYNPQALAAAERDYQREYDAYQEQKRREEEQRRQEEARRHARAADQSSSSSYRGQGGVTDFWLGSRNPMAYVAVCAGGFSPVITAGVVTPLGRSWCVSDVNREAKCEVWSARAAAEWACR